jgi:MoxR-vWA-beta-propeller ternary system domain bpX4
MSIGWDNLVFEPDPRDESRQPSKRIALTSHSMGITANRVVQSILVRLSWMVGRSGLQMGSHRDMSAFQDFLTQLLDQGKIRFRSAEAPRDQPAARDVAILAEAFEAHALSVAGPRIAFDSTTAREAAELVRQSSWALVNRDERLDDLKRRVRISGPPRTPSQHLSADLLLRYVPQILNRARALDYADPLNALLVDVLQCWPLSGVLADVDEAPRTSLDFGEHPGLLLLYAERLAAHDRPAWRPDPSSPAWAYYELIRQRQAGSRD